MIVASYIRDGEKQCSSWSKALFFLVESSVLLGRKQRPDGVWTASLRGSNSILAGAKDAVSERLRTPEQPFAYAQTTLRLCPKAGTIFLKGTRQRLSRRHSIGIVSAHFLANIAAFTYLIFSKIDKYRRGRHSFLMLRMNKEQYEPCFMLKKSTWRKHIFQFSKFGKAKVAKKREK